MSEYMYNAIFIKLCKYFSTSIPLKECFTILVAVTTAKVEKQGWFDSLGRLREQV